MKININNIDLDDLEDDPLPDREKFKPRPKRQPKVDKKEIEKASLDDKETDNVLLRQ